MKKILLLLTLITFSAFAQNPDYHRYGARTKFVQPDTLSTSLRNALSPKLGTLIYHKDTGVSQWEQWNGDSWEELGGGAVDSVQGYTGDVIISPDDLDDFSTFNKFVTQEEKELIDTALQDAPSDGNEYVRKDGDWEVATGGGGAISNEAYNATTWDGVDTIAPSKNAVRDKFASIDLTLSNVVTTNTNQVITGFKSFSTPIGIDTGTSSGGYLAFSNNSSISNLDQVAINRRDNKLAFKSTLVPSTSYILFNGDDISGGDKTYKFQNKSGTIAMLDDIPSGGATNAENVIVSPAIGGNTDAYAVMLANRTSIDSIQANMSSGVNTAFRTVTSTAGVFTEAYNSAQPNFELSLDEDVEITITDAVNGEFLIAVIYNEDVSEDDFEVTLKGTNEDLVATIPFGERAYFTMVTDARDDTTWLRSYADIPANISLDKLKLINPISNSETAELYIDVDVQNISEEALYIAGHENSTRLFFGTALKGFHSLDFRYVNQIEHIQQLNIGTTPLSIGNSEASHGMYRNGNNVTLLSSGPSGGYDFVTDNGSEDYVADTVVGRIGNTGISTMSQYRLSSLNTAPTSSTDTGTVGEIRITSAYIYVCVGTNTWVRAALNTF